MSEATVHFYLEGQALPACTGTARYPGEATDPAKVTCENCKRTHVYLTLTSE